MKFNAAQLLLAAATVILAACNNSSDIGKGPIEKAVSAKLEKGAQACVPSPSDEFPYAVSDAVKGSWPKEIVGRLTALESAGLIAGTPQPGKTVWNLTDNGNKYFTSVTVNGAMGRTTSKQFCFGKRTLKEVLSQAEQPSAKGPGMAVVKYKWTISSPAPWASNDAIKNAFSRQLALEGQSEMLLVKTNDGWKAE